MSQHRKPPAEGDLVELHVWRFAPPRRLALAVGSCPVPELVPIAEEWAPGWVYSVDEDGSAFELRFEDDLLATRVIRVNDTEWRPRATRR